MNIELDVEKNLQAQVAKDRIRIKEFFIDFDKLRKGVVGEAAVSTSSNLFFQLLKFQLQFYLNNPLTHYYSFEHAWELLTSNSKKVKLDNYWLNIRRLEV